MNCEINYLRNFWDYSSWLFKLLNPLGANPTKTPTSSFISITVIKLKVFHVFLIKFARAKINIFFLPPTWLPQVQLWATIEGAASLN